MKNTYILALCLVCCFALKAMEEEKSKPRHVSSMLNMMRRRRQVVEIISHGNMAVNEQDDEGKTPLLQAVSDENPEIVEYCLNMKADPHLAAHDGIAPLHEAATSNNITIMNSLLAAKAIPDQATENGSTALHLAAALCCKDAVRVLVQHGSPIEAQNNFGVNVLHAAAAEGHADILSTLMSKEFDPAALSAQTTLSKETPLHRGVKSGSFDVVEKLVEACSPLNIQDALGKTPVVIAVERRQKDIVAYLLDQGADPEIVAPESGDTIVHKALPDLELVKTILVHAQFKPNNEQTTAWQHLSRCEIVRELNLLDAQVREMAVAQFVESVSIQRQVSICSTRKCEEILAPEIRDLMIRENVERNINYLAHLLNKQDSGYATPSFRAQQRHCLLAAILDPQGFQESLRPLLEDHFKCLLNL